MPGSTRGCRTSESCRDPVGGDRGWGVWRAADRRRCSASTPTPSICSTALPGRLSAHPLGTDELGRDVCCGCWTAAAYRSSIGIAAALAAAALGTLIGLVAGYLGGWADRVLMRAHRRDDRAAAVAVADRAGRARSAVSSACRRALTQSDEISLLRIVVLAVLVGWTTAARLVRGATLVTRNRDFVRAARSLGAGVPHILWLPHPAECARRR